MYGALVHRMQRLMVFACDCSMHALGKCWIISPGMRHLLHNAVRVPDVHACLPFFCPWQWWFANQAKVEQNAHNAPEEPTRQEAPERILLQTVCHAQPARQQLGLGLPTQPAATWTSVLPELQDRAVVRHLLGVTHLEELQPYQRVWL